MGGKQISTPTAIAVAAVFLVLVLGVGYWFVNRASSDHAPTKAESESYLKGDMDKLKANSGHAPTNSH